MRILGLSADYCPCFCEGFGSFQRCRLRGAMLDSRALSWRNPNKSLQRYDSNSGARHRLEPHTQNYRELAGRCPQCIIRLR
jgi:hypothetical protein